MARWTVGDPGSEFVIETTRDGRISLAIPSGKPIIADPEKAETIRAQLGAAIGTAQGRTS